MLVFFFAFFALAAPSHRSVIHDCRSGNTRGYGRLQRECRPQHRFPAGRFGVWIADQSELCEVLRGRSLDHEHGGVRVTPWACVCVFSLVDDACRLMALDHAFASSVMQVRNRLLRVFDAPRKYEGTAADLISGSGFDRWEEERMAVYLFCTVESLVRQAPWGLSNDYLHQRKSENCIKI